MDSKQSSCLITFVVLFILWILIMASTKLISYYRKGRRSNQTADIWNISGRVNQEGPVTSEPHRWPTHDHHVSIDSFVIPENLQSHKKDRVPPPPPYCEVDLPTYEQATGVTAPKNDIPSVHITPSSSSSRNYEGQRS